MTTAPLLKLDGLTKHFPVRRGPLQLVRGHARAVDGVDLTIQPSETVGLVGESGSGKSTLGRLILRLLDPTAGRIVFDGQDVARMSRRGMRALRRDLQMIFQDPYSSFDPRATLGDSLAEPLIATGTSPDAIQERLTHLVERVAMEEVHLHRYPGQFSGGQLQRLAIARALTTEPKLVVCDEPVSALDVSTQAQVINLLGSLQADYGTAYLFIAHDLSVVHHLSDRIAVMYLGQLVELGHADQVVHAPRHPYTEALLSAVPVPDPRTQRTRKRIVLSGDIASPVTPPAGCRFHTRCPYVMDVCRSEDPPAFPTDVGGWAACHLHTHGPTLDGAPVANVQIGQT